MLSELDLSARAQKRLDFFVQNTVTLNSAYSSGQQIGSTMTITGSSTQEGLGEAYLSNILQSICVYDPTGQSAAMDLFFFNQSVTGTYADKTTFNPTVADMYNCIAVVNIAAADYTAAGTGGSIVAALKESNLAKVIKAVSQTSAKLLNPVVTVIAVSRGTPTYTVSPMQFRFQLSNGL